MRFKFRWENKAWYFREGDKVATAKFYEVFRTWTPPVDKQIPQIFKIIKYLAKTDQ